MWTTGTFGRAWVPQKLINLALYCEILLLQKFNDIGGKILEQKKITLQLQMAVVYSDPNLFIFKKTASFYFFEVRV